MQNDLVSQLREVVRLREATIAHLHSEQQQAGIMLEAVRAERNRLQHEVCTYQTPQYKTCLIVAADPACGMRTAIAVMTSSACTVGVLSRPTLL